MDILRWIIGIHLLALGVYLSILNAGIPIKVGALWMWAPLFLDYGCFPLVLFTAYYYLLGAGRHPEDDA